MAQRYVLFFIILAAILFPALSLIHAEDYRPNINIWPLFYYNKDTVKDEKEIEVLYPFFSFKKSKEITVFSIRPLYSVKKIPKENYKKSESPWPLRYAVYTENRVYKRTFPFYSYTRDTSGKIPEKDITFFPFFFSRTYNGKDFALFPFYGTFHNRFNQDRIQFVLWPIYTKVGKGDRRSWNIIWPVFNYSKSTESNEYGYKFWPFYGKREKEGRYKKGFIMWPLYMYVYADVKDIGEYRGWATLPFYVSEKTPVSDSRSVLWPFFNHIKDRLRKFERWDYPFPIATRIKSKERDKNAFLPFWSIDRMQNSKTLSLAYPLFWSMQYEAGFSKTNTVRFLPFYWKRDEYLLGEEKHAGLRQIWPFYKQEEFEGSTKREILSLYPLLDDESWARNWRPFFTIFEQEKDEITGKETTRFLWRVYHKEKTPQFSYLEMAPFFSLYKDNDSKDTYISLFANMVKYRKRERDRHITLFYLLKIPLNPARDAKNMCTMGK